MTPTGKAYHRIKRMTVSAGFLGGLELRLADGLNCFIGGRGAGKTTALEFLRYGLGLMPDQKANGQRYRVIEGLVKTNLPSGRIDIDIETKAGIGYRVGRALGETVQVIDGQGAAVPVSLERDLIFGADVFSQNEIEEIATDATAQLELLDRFDEAESQRIARELSLLDTQLRVSSETLQALDSAIEEVAAHALEVPALEEKLKALSAGSGPNASTVTAAHEQKALRLGEASIGATLVKEAEKVERELRALVAGYNAATDDLMDTRSIAGPNATLMKALRAEGTGFEEVLTASARSVASALERLRTSVTELDATLVARHAEQEAEYRTLLGQLEEEGGRAAERLQVQATLAVAQAAAREKEAKEKQRMALRTRRDELLGALSELRDTRFRLRKRVAQELTERFDSLRITVSQAADLTSYRELLAEALRGTGIQQGKAAEKIADTVLPSELAVIVREQDAKRLQERIGGDVDRAKRIVAALAREGTAYALEEVEMTDRPSIELRHGETFKESSHLSTGQRCTTILPILLVQNERPLLIDQPEDNLDNQFVFDTIVRALEQVRGARQVIFVTHNPNIPVLGEAERVFVFDSDGERAVLRKSGDVDACKEEIERILEGGRDAFLRRKERYGH